MSDDNGDASSECGPARQANGRFGPGNPGRRAGSRNKMSQQLVMAILADFERHRESVLSRLRSDHAAAYARLVARFLPAGEIADEVHSIALRCSVSESSIVEIALRQLFRHVGPAALGAFLREHGGCLRRSRSSIQ